MMAFGGKLDQSRVAQYANYLALQKVFCIMKTIEHILGKIHCYKRNLLI